MVCMYCEYLGFSDSSISALRLLRSRPIVTSRNRSPRIIQVDSFSSRCVRRKLRRSSNFSLWVLNSWWITWAPVSDHNESSSGPWSSMLAIAVLSSLGKSRRWDGPCGLFGCQRCLDDEDARSASVQNTLQGVCAKRRRSSSGQEAMERHRTCRFNVL